MIQADDYRLVLADELSHRQNKNRSYSERAFARDIGVTPQLLNRVLRGQSGISGAAASEIARRLNFDGHDTELFVALVESCHARSAKRRAEASNVVIRLRSNERPERLSYDYEKGDSLSFWALSVSLDRTDFRSDLDWLASELGISRDRAENAMRALVDAGWIRKEPDGRLVATEQRIREGNCYFNPDPISSRRYNLDRRALADAFAVAMSDDPPLNFNEVMMLAISRSEAPQIALRMREEFIKIIAEYSDKTKVKDSVFSFVFSMNEFVGSLK